MTPSEVSFLRRLVAGRPTDRRHDGVAARMSEVEGLGTVRGARVVYAEQDFTRAASILRSRGFELQAPAEAFARSQAPRGGSEKTGARRVTHGLVAVVPVGMGDALAATPGSFIAMPWTAALALPYEALLVSENLEPLMLLERYRWLENFFKGRPILAVFRGAPGMFGNEAATKLIAQDTRPTLAFFDFDPKGLSMAASLPRREALCLPPWHDLEAATRAARRDHLFSNSAHQCRAHLDHVPDSQIALAWQRLKALAVGLDQEGFPK